MSARRGPHANSSSGPQAVSQNTRMAYSGAASLAQSTPQAQYPVQSQGQSPPIVSVQVSGAHQTSMPYQQFQGNPQAPNQPRYNRYGTAPPQAGGQRMQQPGGQNMIHHQQRPNYFPMHSYHQPQNPVITVFNPGNNFLIQPSVRANAPPNSGITHQNIVPNAPPAVGAPYFQSHVPQQGHTAAPQGHQTGAPIIFNNSPFPYQFGHPPPQLPHNAIPQANPSVGVNPHTQGPSGARPPATPTPPNYNVHAGVSSILPQNGTTQAMMSQHHTAGSTVPMSIQQQNMTPTVIPTVPASVTLSTSSGLPQRRPNAIKIIHPDTGKNVLDEVRAETDLAKSSSESSKEESSLSNADSNTSTVASANSATASTTSSDKNEEVKQSFVDMVYKRAREPDKTQSNTTSDSGHSGSDSGKMHSENSNDTSISTSNTSSCEDDKLIIHTEKKPSGNNLHDQTPITTILSTSTEEQNRTDNNSVDCKSKSNSISIEKSTAVQKDETDCSEEKIDGDLDSLSGLVTNDAPSQNASEETDKSTDAIEASVESAESDSLPNNVSTSDQIAKKPIEMETSSQPESNVVTNNIDAPVNEDEPKINEELVNSSSNKDVTSGGDDPSEADVEDSKRKKLKYAYEEDQWSPNNPNGRKRYGRKFLMQLQKDPLSLQKPSNLPNMEIIRERLQVQERQSMNRMGGQPDWLPLYVKPTVSKGSGITKKGSASGKKPEGASRNKIVIQGLSIQEKVELHTSDMAWKPGKLAAANGESDELMDLRKKARSILNKLTPQKFDILVNKFSELQIDTEEKLKMCMELVFEKAVDEPSFSVAYARMCEVLSKKEYAKDPEVGSQKTFRKLLIARCQAEFEKDYMEDVDNEAFKKKLEEETSEEKKKDIKAEWEEEERKARRRSNGNIRFIGELFKFNMLTVRIMHECCSKLLKRKDEESLECFCKLLTTVGKDLEAQSIPIAAAPNSDKKKIDLIKEFPAFFDEVQKIIDSKTTSSRVRFLLQDLIDLRKNKWVPRREIVGPTTIDKIHQDAYEEKTRQQLENFMAKNSGGPMGSQNRNDRDRMKRAPRGPMSSGGSSGLPTQQSGEDGWNMVGSSNRLRSGPAPTAADIQKLTNNLQRLKNPVDADSLQLGPGSRGSSYSSWGQGSGGTRHSQTKGDSSVSHQNNRFATLSPATDGQDIEVMKRGGSRSIGVPGRSSRGHSRESERQKAIQAVRDSANGPNVKVNAGRSGPTASLPPPSKPVSVSSNQADSLKGESNLSEETIITLGKPILAEFLHSGIESEAIACISEKFHPSTIGVFVNYVFEDLLERSPRNRERTGKLLESLVKTQMLTRNQFEGGLLHILNHASDLVIDIPNMWDNLGEIIAPILAENTLPISMILDTAKKGLMEDESRADFAGKYAASIIHKLSTIKDKSYVASQWQKAGLTWDKFVPKDRALKFVVTNNLEYTEIVGPLATQSDNSEPLSMDEIGKSLRNLLSEKKTNDDIFNWIEKNVGKRAKEHSFIRILTESIIQSAISGSGGGQCELKEKQLTDRVPVFKRFLDANVEREKQALYALQHLMHKLEHPNKMLGSIFEKLYENDLVSEDGFQEWKDCTNPAEQEGKGVAMTSTNQFFIWLAEAVEEEDEDEK